MKPVNVSGLKQELKNIPQKELVDICLKLAKFKKENKELLTYILFDSDNEELYIKEIKEEVDVAFSEFNYDSLYYVKKGARKMLRALKKYIRFSKNKETETELLLYFCSKLKAIKPSYKNSQQLINMYQGQLKMAKKAITYLHEDLQHDFSVEIEKLDL